MKINLIYGTETGFTKSIGEDILRLWDVDGHETRLIKVDEAATEDWRADLLIMGAPTWCEPRLDTFGEYSDDWNETDLTKVDFKDQTVALFGLGDQVGYGNNFVDALGMMAGPVLKGGGKLIGKVPTKLYDYELSQGEDGEGNFWGLPIDEDNEPTHSPQRIMEWVAQLKKELNVE